MTVTQLRGEKVIARDGPVGSLDDVYFDEEAWTVRYLLVDTGARLAGGLLLVPRAAVADDLTGEAAVHLTLTCAQAQAIVREGSSRLRSGVRLIGFAVEGHASVLGELEDFAVNAHWRITELVVADAARGTRLGIAPRRIARVDLAARTLFLDGH